MKNSLIIIICFWLQSTSAQMIEAQSRPYRFSIEKMLSYEGKSSPKSYDIQHYRVKIRKELEIQIGQWHREKGIHISNQEIYDREFVQHLEKIQPDIIQRAGLMAMDRSRANYLFIPEELAFEIQFNDFEPVKIDIPIENIEEFKSNFNKIEFSKQQISFNDNNRFVITEMRLFDPISRESYQYISHNEIQSPSFTVSLPKEEL